MNLPEPVAQIAFHYARNESNKITVDLPIETRLFTEAQMREALAQQEAVMRMALEALEGVVAYTALLDDFTMHASKQALKALEEQLK